MPRRQDLWTYDEKNKLRRACLRGIKFEEMGDIFPNRSPRSLLEMAKKLQLYSWKTRERMAAVVSVAAPISLWEARDARANEPRTLTMEFMGDPPPSRSALGRPCQ